MARFSPGPSQPGANRDAYRLLQTPHRDRRRLDDLQRAPSGGTGRFPRWRGMVQRLRNCRRILLSQQPTHAALVGIFSAAARAPLDTSPCDLHAFNYGDITWWDRLFGTFREADQFADRCGFPEDHEQKLGQMLAFMDVY